MSWRRHAGPSAPRPPAELAGKAFLRPALASSRMAARGTALRVRGARGVALILVLSVIAILTAVGVDFSYNSRVGLRLAENARDELRAYYLARSAVAASRLLLHFQRQIDQAGAQIPPAMLGMLQQVMGGGAAPQLPPLPQVPGLQQGQQSGGLGIRLWEIVPIDSNAATMLLGSGTSDDADKPTNPDAPKLEAGVAHDERSFGDFTGTFGAKIADENSRINVQGLGHALGNIPGSTYIQLKALIENPRYDFLFDEDDAHGDRVQRADLILALHDWTSDDQSGASIDPTNPLHPFVAGFADKNGAYQRYQPPYKSKNAAFDSLQELYMVRGVSDRFMAAFGDHLTVWAPTSGLLGGKLNVNTDDPIQMAVNIFIAARNPNDPMLQNPLLIQTILQEIRIRKLFSFFGLSLNDFLGILLANRVDVNPLAASAASGFLTDKSDTFRIVATGKVGRVEKKITAVVQYDEWLGKLSYWREE